MYELTDDEKNKLIETLKNRFENNMNRHLEISWDIVSKKLLSSPNILWSLNEMEKTGGEPDVIIYNNNITFIDCSKETPVGRRSLCYDDEALNSRKDFKPVDSAINMANKMRIEIIDEEEYKNLQKYGEFDLKTSSWIKTPNDIRKLGGAIYGDRRYNRIFIYHNGAESYYGVRGFRGSLTL